MGIRNAKGVMVMKATKVCMIALVMLLFLQSGSISFSDSIMHFEASFPMPIDTYNDPENGSIIEILIYRGLENPFNLVASIIFMLAIAHAFLSSKILSYAKSLKADESSIKVGLLHFMGEVEVVFGLWSLVLGIAIALFYNWETYVNYVGELEYTEPVFVIVIMTIAASRPILKLVELMLWKIVKTINGKLEVWWFVILTVGPLLGSLITEPAAMIISAYLLADKFFDLYPSKNIKYATLALLFVNVSIGGTLTNFAAPPILMIAAGWQWSTPFMFIHFGWKAILAILINNTLVVLYFKKEFVALEETYKKDRFKKYVQRRFIDKAVISEQIDAIEWHIDKNLGYSEKLNEISEAIKAQIEKKAHRSLSQQEQMDYDIDEVLSQRFDSIKINEMKRTIPGLLPKELRPFYRDPEWDYRDDKLPFWIMVIHLLFLTWVVVNDHQPVLFIGGFLFFLGFVQVTAEYQNRINLKPALMVAFFLSGLIIHSGVQAWWIEPVLANLSSGVLNITAIVLTAFNDNAAITYLSSLVPHLSDPLKYAVVSGAVTGGGLTLIANAPNPIGQSILKRYFKVGIEPFLLFKAALVPTLIVALIFRFL